MQRWEYLILRAIVGDWKITHINGQQMSKFKGLFSTTIEGPNLHDNLNRLGLEGWEVVGIAGDQASAINFVLKRPVA